MPDVKTGAASRREQYARWARLLDTILPVPDEHRPAPVAEADGTAFRSSGDT